MQTTPAIQHALAALQGPEAVDRFLDEIFTASERRDVALRWEIVKGLHRGETQRAVAETLGVSLCKVTRGARVLKRERSVTRDLLERFFGSVASKGRRASASTKRGESNHRTGSEEH